MLEGQQIGPFIIDKELGAGAMGSVYKARYTRTGQVVALKLVTLSLSANEQALARFEREASILKQLKHPNIVRLFGTGRHQKTPYYAMEYIEGESLDHVLARKGRQNWEEVVELGKQLCAALQHAHDKGIIHRDLKPSNLMLLPDGTLKLTDFGIAKDLDETALTAANCTVGTASYMSPEQCKGERDLTPKSDLYSLGVVFYELLTGKKPFSAETPMDMFMQHIHGKFVRPSKLVMDIPPWLDNLVCQLLEKTPDNRPRDAEMVARSLEQVAEKVSALRSAGVDAVTGRGSRRPSDSPKDEADREAARTLKHAAKGTKPRKKKAAAVDPIWFKAGGIIAGLILVVGAIWLVMRPPSAEGLYKKAEKLMTTGDPDDWEEARDGPIEKYLQAYGKRDDAQAKQVKEWAADVDAYRLDRKLMRLERARKGQLALKMEPNAGAETAALEAAMVEDTGDLAKAAPLWQEIRQKYEGDPAERTWARLAAKKLNDIQTAEQMIQSLAVEMERVKKVNANFVPRNEVETLAKEVIEREIEGDMDKAREAWQELKKKHEQDVDKHLLVLIAAKKVRDLTKAAPKETPKN